MSIFLTRFRLQAAVILFSLVAPFFTSFSEASPLSPKRSVTENGITLLWLEQNTLPIVSVHVLVRAGSVFDPREKPGVANMTASLLEEGTHSRSAREISETADFIGARFGARAEKDYTTVQLRVLKKELATGFALLADVLMHPRFDEREVARIQKQVLGGIRAEKDRPNAIALRAFQAAVYGQHPYRHAVAGDEKSVPKISREDLIAFYKQYYRPNNTIIAIVGDIKEDAAKKLLRDYLGLWQSAPLVFPETAPISSPKKFIQHIEKDLTQATVMLGHGGIHRASPDYYPVRVMNYILGGGGFSSRMMADIRDDRGLVYSIYSRFSTNRLPGDFSVSLQTKNSTVKEAIEGALQEISAIRKTPVSAVELEEAKAYLAGSFPLRIDTGNKVARLLTRIEFYGLGLGYFEAHVKAIRAVTREDVLRVAKRYLNPDHYTLIVVGKEAEMGLSSDQGHRASD